MPNDEQLLKNALRMLEMAFAMRDAQRHHATTKGDAALRQRKKLEERFDTARWEFKGYEKCSSD